jgi:hypothetical protein
MKLRVYHSLWGNSASGAPAIATARVSGFDGIEGPAPATAEERREWRTQLDDAGLDYIAEICTMGSYIPPAGATTAQHLASLRTQMEAALECAPRFITTLAGSDSWPLAESVAFLGAAMEVARELGTLLSVETHRSRCTYSPWVTRELLQQLPELWLTCDFSHWCCVCERLVLDEEPALLALCAERAHHLHARVGYDQGPQVPHPGAPEYAPALKAHEGWWDAIWNAQERAGQLISTMTPEFGPDGYLHTIPFSVIPVADLGDLNCWMAERQRSRFADRFAVRAA